MFSLLSEGMWRLDVRLLFFYNKRKKEERMARDYYQTMKLSFEQICRGTRPWVALGNCATYEIACPLWVEKPQYVLTEPWYMDHPRKYWRERRKETAEEFRHHNIYCGNRVYTNKYERDEQGFPLRTHPVNLQERLAVVRPAGERLAREWAERDRLIREYLPTAEALRAAYRERKQVVQG
jgi:hypothetical protein